MASENEVRLTWKANTVRSETEEGQRASLFPGGNLTMDVFQIDEKGLLFIAPDIDDWGPLDKMDIHVIFDLDDDLDIGVPEIPDQLLYIYFPFEDKELPDLAKLHENAKLGASMISQGYRVLCHCGMGHNRSALLAGLILTYLGMSGEEAITQIRKQRMGALYNKKYAGYLQGMPSQKKAGTASE